MKNLTVGESVPGLYSLTYLEGNHLSARQVFFTGFHSESLKIITHDWKSCSCVLNFPFPLFFFFFFFLPSLSISEAEQPNLGNYWSLGDTEDFQMVFMFFGTVYIWLISFSRNSWIPPLLFFLFAVMKTRFAALGEGRGAEESEAGKQKMNLF